MSDFDNNEPNELDITTPSLITTTDATIYENISDEPRETFVKKDAHPCQYCGNSCYGNWHVVFYHITNHFYFCKFNTPAQF